MLRRCLDCPALIRSGSRCPACARRYRSGYARATWARGVKARDGHRCRDCGAAGALVAHHIVPLAAGGSAEDPRNGLCLCKRCHARRHGGDAA